MMREMGRVGEELKRRCSDRRRSECEIDKRLKESAQKRAKGTKVALTEEKGRSPVKDKRRR
jgi:hypothetical protein